MANPFAKKPPAPKPPSDAERREQSLRDSAAIRGISLEEMRAIAERGPPSESEVKTAVRAAIADNKSVDDVVEGAPTPAETVPLNNLAEELNESDAESSDRIDNEFIKLSKLVEDDFPFDESQIAAINGLVQEEYGCLTGAAGTGKTTCEKKLVDRLLETVSLEAVNMHTYWKEDYEPEEGDEYDSNRKWVPSVALVSFTGRATQMIKKNFPRDWHGNIMTIHRLLGFMPEYYDDWDEELQEYRKKMRFVPTYDADCLLPWDIVIIDEAGMLGLDLWHQLWAACKPGCRIYMIGDINQLPPVHGKPIFGFALAKWPAWELTHVHRQQGVNNPIVDNAWRILHGRNPVSEGRFQMIELQGDAPFASRKVQAIVSKLRDMTVYDPIRDTIITPINGEDGSRGRELGQIPLNERFALMFNPKSEHPRYVIDGGRDRKRFAVGDKVMATKNDWEAGITNGMTGVITEIAENAGYAGEKRRFGKIEDVNAYMAEIDGDETHVDFSFEDLESDFEAIDEGMKAKKEKKDRGPSSHIVTVRFGDEEHGIEIPFQSLSEVGSLMTAYVCTCHKMQGGESPVIIIICHDAHRSMLYREWLYTAVTRASEKCILLYSTTALRVALNKQKIKGATLQEKVRAFMEWVDPKGIMGAAMLVNLPESKSRGNRITDRASLPVVTEARLTTEAEKKGGLASLIRKQAQAPGPAARMAKILDAVAEPTVERVVHIHTPTVERETVILHEPRLRETEPIDSGELKPAPRDWDRARQDGLAAIDARMAGIRQERESNYLAPPGSRAVIPIGPVHTLRQAARPEPLLLTHQPAAKRNPWAVKLGQQT